MERADPGDQAGDPAAAAARTGRRLALLGFLPFAGLSLWLFGIAAEHPWRAITILLLKTYAAIVLSFLGGIRWGLALRRDGADVRRDLAAGILLPLAGWSSVFAPVPYAFALLAVVFAAAGAWDSFAVHAGTAPPWFGRMRALMTALVVAAMVLAFVGTARGAAYPGASLSAAMEKMRPGPSM